MRELPSGRRYSTVGISLWVHRSLTPEDTYSNLRIQGVGSVLPSGVVIDLTLGPSLGCDVGVTIRSRV